MDMNQSQIALYGHFLSVGSTFVMYDLQVPFTHIFFSVIHGQSKFEHPKPNNTKKQVLQAKILLLSFQLSSKIT